MSGHGAQSPVPLEALLSDDPELELATANAHEWLEAHPCECEAMCECEAEEEE